MSSLLIIFVIIVFSSGFCDHHHHHHHIHEYHTFDASPPPQDECKLVNATEPPQCPMTIGPPCPPCFTNVLPDYKKGDDLNFSDANRETMRRFIDYYTNWWNKNYPPSKQTELGGFNIYNGTAGRGYIFYRLYINTGNVSYLNLSAQYLNRAISQLPSAQYYSGFVESHAGVFTLKALIEHSRGNDDGYRQYLVLINNTFNNVNDAIQKGLSLSSDGINMTILGNYAGLTGLVYNGVFINAALDSIESNILISPQVLANITFYVMDKSIETGRKLNTDYLQVEMPWLAGCFLYSTNHGPTGLIHQFLQAMWKYPEAFDALMNNAKYYNAIKNTLDFYISVQLPDGNMPTQINGTCYKKYGNDSDARVQFCHGAPGFINVYMEAVLAFSKFNTTAAVMYFHTALVTANVTWNRGLLVKGTMFCHGIGANINMLWEFAFLINVLQQTSDKEFLQRLENEGYDLEFIKRQSIWRAKQFTLWTLDWSNLNQTRMFYNTSDEGGYSMAAGNFAIGGMLYSQLIRNDSWPYPHAICQPGWNLCV